MALDTTKPNQAKETGGNLQTLRLIAERMEQMAILQKETVALLRAILLHYNSNSSKTIDHTLLID